MRLFKYELEIMNGKKEYLIDLDKITYLSYGTRKKRYGSQKLVNGQWEDNYDVEDIECLTIGFAGTTLELDSEIITPMGNDGQLGEFYKKISSVL